MKEVKISNEEKDDSKNGCEKCRDGCSDCIICCCKGIYSSLISLKDCIISCCSCWWYPLKERCLNCCNECEKGKHPYKDPNYNPYDDI